MFSKPSETLSAMQRLEILQGSAKINTQTYLGKYHLQEMNEKMCEQETPLHNMQPTTGKDEMKIRDDSTRKSELIQRMKIRIDSKKVRIPERKCTAKTKNVSNYNMGELSVEVSNSRMGAFFQLTCPTFAWGVFN